MNIGEKIHDLRKKNRMSTASLADEVGVPRHIVSSWESGDITPDSVELKKIAQALNVSIDTLLNRTEYYNNTDLLTNAYDDYKEKNKGKIIFLIFTFIVIFLIVGDTLLAIALKKSPIISWRVPYLSGDSYVDKGIFMNTYYCVKEKDLVYVTRKFKLANYECPSYKSTNNKTNRQVKNIQDTSQDIKDFRCSSALEKFYEDEDYAYYLECTNSSYIIVTYYNDIKENIKDALEKGQITIKDLDEYKIKYTKKDLDKQSEPELDPINPKPESEYPKKEELEAADFLTFYLHKNNAAALETTFIVEDEKVIAINTKTNARKLIFDEEPVQSISPRVFGATGDTRLIILTTTGNVYISSIEINYAYEFGKELKMDKMDLENITEFKILRKDVMDTHGALIAIDKDGNEHYVKESY